MGEAGKFVLSTLSSSRCSGLLRTPQSQSLTEQLFLQSWMPLLPDGTPFDVSVEVCRSHSLDCMRQIQVEE